MIYKKTFKVVIKNISVWKYGMYCFDFYLYENGKLKEWGNLDGSFSQRSADAFRKVLKRGWAHQLVLQQYY